MAFWVVSGFPALSAIVFVLSQTTSPFAYEFAVRLGLQESVEDVSQVGVEVNRAFGAGDTAICIPLIAISLTGLVLRRRWALLTTAAAVGVSAYWPVTVAALLVFLWGVPGYDLVPGPEYWIFLGAYVLFGVRGMRYLVLRGEKLID